MDMNEYTALVCSQCGGNQIKFDSNTNTALCLYCNTTFVIGKNDEHSSSKKIDNAELYLHKFNDLKTAEKYYKEAAELNPHNFRCWWGLAKVITKNFTVENISSNNLHVLDEYIKKACLTSSDEICNQISSVYNEYRRKILDNIDGKRRDIKEKITYNEERVIKIESEIKEKKLQSTQIAKQIKDLRERKTFSNHSELIKGAVAPMLISAIIAFLLASVLFSNPGWDSSTWIVGVPAIIAASVFLISLLIVIVCSSIDSKSKSNNNKVDKDIENLSRKKEEIDKELKNLYSEKNDIYTNISILNNKKNQI